MNQNGARTERLCLFTRYPRPGTTKTRLIGLLGKTGAADLQRRMTEHVLKQVRLLIARRHLHLEIRFDGGDVDRMRQWLGTDLDFTVQGSGDIGRRMARAFEAAAADGVENAVIIGADIPGISPDILKRAFDGLAQHNLVLGPAKDGGYYLIGIQTHYLTKVQPGLFRGIDWGTDTVLANTLGRANDLGLTYSLMTPLGDVDRPADIGRWEAVLADEATY